MLTQFSARRSLAEAGNITDWFYYRAWLCETAVRTHMVTAQFANVLQQSHGKENALKLFGAEVKGKAFVVCLEFQKHFFG